MRTTTPTTRRTRKKSRPTTTPDKPRPVASLCTDPQTEKNKAGRPAEIFRILIPMGKTADICDRRVDDFVNAVNASPREELFYDEAPPECVISVDDEYVEWRIVPSSGAEWLPGFEALFPFRLPRTFRSLVARYLFPAFEAEPLVLYSVGVREPELTREELRLAIFADKFMSPFLLSRGLLPFARPADWSYDPICFDLRNSNRKSEPPVVRVDHEEILCNERLRVIETISPAFHELLGNMTAAMKANSKSKST